MSVTDTQKEQALQLVNEGKSVREAAELTGLSKSTVGRLRASHGAPAADSEEQLPEHSISLFMRRLEAAKADLAQAEADLAQVQEKRLAAAMEGIEALQQWRQKAAQAEAVLEDAQAIVDAMEAEKPHAKVRHYKGEAETLEREAAELDAKAAELRAQVQPLYDQIAAIQGENWRSEPLSAHYELMAQRKRDGALYARLNLRDKERELVRL